jgi:uroporphyrinogen decarboxylase
MRPSPAECVRAAFEHRSQGLVPVYHAGFSSAAAGVLLGREAYVGGGIQQWREAMALWQGPDAHAEFLERSQKDALDLAVAAGCDMVRTQYWRMPERPSQRVDEATFLYGDPDGDYRVYRFDSPTELYQCIEQRPPPHPESEEEMEAHVARVEDEAEAYLPTPDLLEPSHAALWRFRAERAIPGAGWGLAVPRDAAWLEAMALRPDLVGRYLDAQVCRSVRNIEFQRDQPFTYLLGGGDFASNHGPFYSPRAFRELILPRLQRIAEAARRCGKYALFASDGNLWPVADDLFGRSGIAGYYEIDGRAGMDLRRLRDRFPRLTLVGNIASYTLHLGTRAEVVAETRACAEAALELGGIVAGISNQVVAQTPPENVLAMVETLREYQT